MNCRSSNITTTSGAMSADQRQTQSTRPGVLPACCIITPAYALNSVPPAHQQKSVFEPTPVAAKTRWIQKHLAAWYVHSLNPVLVVCLD